MSIENEMKPALLFRLGGLGDLMIALLSICLLKKKFPPCSLTLVCRQEYGLILRETGVVDEIVPLSHSRLAPFFASPPYPQELTQWLGEFSLILGWMQKESSLNHKELCSFLGREKCRFFVPDPDFPGQISKYFFEKTLEFLVKEENLNPSFSDCALLPLSSSQKEDGLELFWEAHRESEEKAAYRREKLVVVHPGSGSKSKCWPLENFMEVIHRLSPQGFRGALVTGFAEVESVEKIRRHPLPENWVWLRNPPLLELSGLLSASALYLGNDSGITHLAAACGTKVVALFQKNLEVAWKPYGRTTVLSRESVPAISRESVWEVLSRNLG